MNKLLITATAASALIAGAGAFAANPEDVEAKYRAQFEKLRAEGEALKKNQPSAVGVTLGIDCKTKMGLQTIAIPVPEVTMRLETFIFHMLEFKWDSTRIGPVVMHLPQFKWGEQTVKMHWPEIKNGVMKIKMDLPEVTCGDARVNLESVKLQGASLEARAKSLAEKMKKELGDAQKGPLLEQKKTALDQVDAVIKGFEAMIEQVRGAKGKVDDFVIKLNELNHQRAKIAQQFDEALAKLGAVVK